MIRLLRDVAVDRVRVAEVFKDFGLYMPVCFPGEQFARVKVLVALDGEVPDEVLRQHAALELVLVDSADAVNLEACQDRGIAVCEVPLEAADSAAELTVALMLASLRRIVVSDTGCREGRWGMWPGGRLKGRTVGVVGTGAVGQRVSTLLQAFGATVLGYSRTRRGDFNGRYVEWNELWSRSSIVSLHLPANDATHQLVGMRELERLGVGALLVNTSSPRLVDQEALLNVLETGRLGAAALDLPDPLDREHPLTALRQVILTPGIAAMTEAAVDQRVRDIARVLAAGVEGRHKARLV